MNRKNIQNKMLNRHRIHTFRQILHKYGLDLFCLLHSTETRIAAVKALIIKKNQPNQVSLGS